MVRKTRTVQITSDPKGISTRTYKQLKLMTKLSSSKKIVMITFKDMTLTIMENDKVVSQRKYTLGDVGMFKYCSAIKSYQSKGYELEGQTSNSDEIFKKIRKEERENNDAGTGS
jgi:hypothetical protein